MLCHCHAWIRSSTWSTHVLHTRQPPPKWHCCQVNRRFILWFEHPRWTPRKLVQCNEVPRYLYTLVVTIQNSCLSMNHCPSYAGPGHRTLKDNPHKITHYQPAIYPRVLICFFIRTYKILSWIPHSCTYAMAPFENAIIGLQPKNKVNWNDKLVDSFKAAQTKLHNNKQIVLSRSDNQLYIVTDGFVSKHVVSSTLYVVCNHKVHLAGFFNAKLHKYQVTWLPCEIESLSITVAIRHFSPYIT